MNETGALRSIQRSEFLALEANICLYKDVHAARRAAGHTSRMALLSSFLAPLHLRKPVPGRACPEGWRTVDTHDHILPGLRGTWWTPA